MSYCLNQVELPRQPLHPYNATPAKRGHTKFHAPLTERLTEKLHRNEEFSLFTLNCKHTHTDTKYSVTTTLDGDQNRSDTSYFQRTLETAKAFHMGTKVTIHEHEDILLTFQLYIPSA